MDTFCSRGCGQRSTVSIVGIVIAVHFEFRDIQVYRLGLIYRHWGCGANASKFRVPFAGAKENANHRASAPLAF